MADDSPTLQLNPRQTAFVQEYLIDLNGTQAAIRAGYSSTSAAETASEFLRNPKIIEAIERGKAQRLSRVNMTQETVLKEMSLLSHSSVDHYYIDDHGQVRLAEGAPDGAMGAIQSIKRRTTIRIEGKGEDAREVKTYDVELRLWDKPTPLKLMGRHVGLFPDRVEHTGKGGGPIETVSRVERVVVDPAKVDG